MSPLTRRDLTVAMFPFGFTDEDEFRKFVDDMQAKADKAERNKARIRALTQC